LSIIGRFALRSKLQRREDATVLLLLLLLRVSIWPARDESIYSEFELTAGSIGWWSGLKSCLVGIRTMAAGRNDVRISRPATWSSTGYREQLIDWQ